MKKINKNSINNYLRKHGLREPDKIDILFGLVSTILIVFCAISSTVDGLQRQNKELLSLNNRLMNRNDYLIEKVNAYEEEFGILQANMVEYEAPTFSLLNKNYYQMSKTQMQEHLSELNSFKKKKKTYGTNETDETKQLIVNGYFKC